MPTIYVIAGPNGIGKTTSSYDILPNNIPVINSDEIAKEARAAGLITSNTDILELFDNTDSMVLAAEFRKGEIVLLDETPPGWVAQFLSHHVQPGAASHKSPKNLSDIDAVRKSYKSIKGGKSQ